MVEIVGYGIVDSKSGKLWGGLYLTVNGAKKAFDLHKGIQDASFMRKMRFDNQDKFIIVPLTYAQEI